MDWMVCPSCGQRYLPTELGCPNCPATARLAISKLQALEVAQAAAPPRQDLSLSLLHGAFTACLLWAVVGWRAPLWVVAVAALELAVAVGSLARWRLARTLVHVRAALCLGAAAVLSQFGKGSLLAFLVFSVHAAAVWAFDRGGAVRGVGESIRDGDGSEARSWFRGLILIPVSVTWLILVVAIRGLAR